MKARAPLVWVASSHGEMKNESGHDQCYTLVDEASTRTAVNLGLQPVSYPRVPLDRIPAMLSTIDGIMLGGSNTNVDPRLFGEEPLDDALQFDEARDAVVQPLERLAIAARVPLIGYCRGSHEINVALGGSLHQSLKRLPSSQKHWEDPAETVDETYIERHDVTTVAGGELAALTGLRRFPASSLHSQGVKALGHGLIAEAHADDGLVEAFRWHDSSQFAWGFQFHPEWGWRWHPVYGRIMRAFVTACEAHFSERKVQPAPLQQSPRRVHLA